MSIPALIFVAVLQAPSVQGGGPPPSSRGHPLELRTSPLVELWLEVRQLSEADGLPEDEDLAAAVEAMRALGEALGSAVGFGLLEGNLEGAADAEELALAFEDLPEVWRSRSGAEIVLREPCLAAAAAVAVVEPRWRENEWPARAKLLAAAEARLGAVLDEHGPAIYARLHATLGLRIEGVQIRVYLVTRAPWPGAFTHRRHGGGSISFVAVEDDLPALAEVVVHETIHALDLETPGPESLLVELRRALVAAGLEPRATRDWTHTLFFLEAGACIRELLDSEHVDYGERTTLYARSKPAVDVERPLWRAYTAGELERAELILSIVAAATEDGE